MNKKKIISVVVLVVVLIVAGFFVFRGGRGLKKVESVATVNGAVISKADYEKQLALAVSSYKTQGINVEDSVQLSQVKTQVLDDMINNELVNQGIKSSGTKVADDIIEKQIQDIITQSGGAEKFKEELVKANLTEAQLRENVTKQLTIQAYLAANIDVSGLTATDKEISDFYTEYSKSQKTASSTISVPALKTLSEQIKQQIISNKQQTLINEFVISLKNKAEIVKTM